VQLACILEAAAPKLGNVHPTAHFADMHFGHFAASAVAIRRAFEAPIESVGQVIHAAAAATAQYVDRNTNLGTLLLFGPLATAQHSIYNGDVRTAAAWQAAVDQTLSNLTPRDSELVYEAIRLAKPGGLGQRAQDDIAAPAPNNLLDAMRQVADIDAVARQYTTTFADIFERLLPWLNAELEHTTDPLEALCRLQVRWLAHEPDGLIVRKLGPGLAHDVQARAQALYAQLLNHNGPVLQLSAARELDQFLRGDAHRRNPGTTADLLAATALVRLVLGGETTPH
jgi:triphosphoribosyl-dephospho-CoA synthase